MSEKRAKRKSKEQKARSRRRIKVGMSLHQKSVQAQEGRVDKSTQGPMISVREAKEEPCPAQAR